MAVKPTSAPSNTPTSLEDFLTQLNLAKYWDVFSQMGFDTLDSLQDLNEQILEDMQVAKGHQGRVLRKALEVTKTIQTTL